MTIRLKSPSQYVQGAGVLQHLDTYLQGMGSHILVLLSAGGMKRIRPTLDACLVNTAFTVDYVEFSGECTAQKIHTLASQCTHTGVDVVIGIGGGKILDTAKGVGYFAKIPMVIVPTVCSSDSPCSSLSVMYHDDGLFDAYLFLQNCPHIVLVDTDVIVSAPVKFLVAGMGDALATWFEARACRRSGSDNQVGAKPTLAATCLAECCWETLKTDGVKAVQAVSCGACTPAVERIIEVNTYLSSVGFESGGLAAAHALQKGLTAIPALHGVQHGEKVAFCTIVQLVLENESVALLREVMGFCRDVGLPICFADMGYTDVTMDALLTVATKACVLGSTVHHLLFDVTPHMLVQGMLAADAMGAQFIR